MSEQFLPLEGISKDGLEVGNKMLSCRDHSKLVRLAYFSKSNLPSEGMRYSEVNANLDVARMHNAEVGITGALLFYGEWFVQILEGDVDHVWRTYQRITRDPRHLRVTFIEMTAVPSRRFENWWMGCGERTGKTAPVFQPYLTDGHLQPTNMSGDRVLSLLIDLSKAGFKERVLI